MPLSRFYYSCTQRFINGDIIISSSGELIFGFRQLYSSYSAPELYRLMQIVFPHCHTFVSTAVFHPPCDSFFLLVLMCPSPCQLTSSLKCFIQSFLSIHSSSSSCGNHVYVVVSQPPGCEMREKRVRRMVEKHMRKCHYVVRHTIF